MSSTHCRGLSLTSRAGLAIAFAICALTPHASFAQQTRAERTGYAETSAYSDVIAFVDSLERRAPGRMVRGILGTTSLGKVLPYLVVSRPLVRTPLEARRSGKPVVYVQANIHGGEVEGKEALQALLRDLVLDTERNVLDSIVLVAVPIYNADGNDAWGPQERQRSEQDGPATIGQRPNGQGFDLNRDYVKDEAPETAASLAMFRAWDPDVFVDLHTTDGSYHGYALTYSPSLHPAAMTGQLAPAGPWTRDTLLPELRRRVRERRGYEVFDYGNFTGVAGQREDPTSLEKGSWVTYEHKPRYGTNYFGLRNGVSVLSEAYSHDPFERRVKSTYAFIAELLSYVGERGRTVTARTRALATPTAVAARAGRTPVPIRARMTTTPFSAPVLVEPLRAMGDDVRHEAGVRAGYVRTHAFTAVTMPVFDRFEPTLTQTFPRAWVLDSAWTPVVDRLLAHGIVVRRLGTAWRGAGESFTVDSLVKASRPFQDHQEVRLEGRWTQGPLTLAPGAWIIPADQPLALLALILLEPQSDDGLTTWNAFDASLAVGGKHPVRRALVTVPLPR
jgi:hypothetical protein